ncbi:ATP-binding cassette domain-containing protein [Magnetofaba australis]|uniref:Putative high-affinity zinc uptake system ATP-binding protein ZnuC n=1 Tax=Magnetofaba australis IT-1 TaxID=1434232 RepID=A0A1Y2K104_9PROT|nr:ATP-binding cassette domain-containing protein [Magnetofaba australis]OSM01730.1 putative high-affinity zinc uptake system ATP-binding protein ZnuC [Magnetofaba australis IT-1]
MNAAAPHTAALLTAEGLSIGFGDQTILSGVDLIIHRAEIVTLIGPNGAGKTTLLKALLGLIKPQSGRIHRTPGMSIGYAPQRMRIDPALPLNVRRLMTLTHRHDDAEILQALQETGVASRLDAPVQGLSGGEFQRALLARALLTKPDLLVLDEPTQGVDFAGEAALYRLIAQLRKHYGCAILMVSHDLHMVMSSTDRVICLNGHICCEGEPLSVARHPEFTSLFGEGLAGAYAVYTHQHDHEHAIDGHVCHTPGCAKRRQEAPQHMDADQQKDAL